jgi:hypothetical protein
VKSGLLLNVVIGKGPTVLKLLSSENEALLIRRDTLLVLDLGLDIIDGIGGLDLEGDGLAGEGLHKDLHSYHKGQSPQRKKRQRRRQKLTGGVCLARDGGG